VGTNRSACAFAFGARNGVRLTPDAFAAKDLVEAGDELRVAVVDREPRVLEARRDDEVARLLHDPAAARMCGAAREVNAPTLKLNEEEHVVAAQKGGLDGEEVAGDDARRLRTQERAPTRPRASRRRSKASTREQAANGARRNWEAELLELAGDALVAPACVLAREPQHRVARFAVDRRPPWPHARVCPPPPHELAVPAQQGLRRDEQAMAAPGREQAACGGEEGAVTRSQPRALDLAAQDIQLMAQNQQLDVLALRGAAAPSQQLQQGDEGE
jgi:hypothetical protein